MSVKPKPKSKTPKPTKVKTLIHAEPPPEMAFDEAVKLGKELAASFQFYEMELGRLADRVEPKYGDKTIERFAKEIGVPFPTLSRCLSVFRAYKGTPIEGTSLKSFGVAQALQAHPERVELLQAEPDMTVRKARGIARAAKKSSQARDNRGWIRAAIAFAQKAQSEYGHPKQEYIAPDVLRDALTDPEQAVSILRRGATALNSVADTVETVLASHPVPPEPMFTQEAAD